MVTILLFLPCSTFSKLGNSNSIFIFNSALLIVKGSNITNKERYVGIVSITPAHALVFIKSFNLFTLALIRGDI